MIYVMIVKLTMRSVTVLRSLYEVVFCGHVYLGHDTIYTGDQT